MRYVPNDKYTIAWFKLAECVAKGEKEKAFGVYRLLMHSLEDQAYAHQLEGDLLNAFCDERANEKYAHAAQLYYHTNRYKEAASLYEDLITQIPEERYIQRLIEIYKQYKTKDIFYSKLIKLAHVLIAKELYIQVMPLIQELESSNFNDTVILLYTKVIINLIKNECDQTLIEPFLYKALDYMIAQKNQLQAFLSMLEQSTYWYQKCCAYIKREDA